MFLRCGSPVISFMITYSHGNHVHGMLWRLPQVPVGHHIFASWFIIILENYCLESRHYPLVKMYFFVFSERVHISDSLDFTCQIVGSQRNGIQGK